jgi:hypothetical protein
MTVQRQPPASIPAPEPGGNAPSSGDGSTNPPRNINTGAVNPNYKAPQDAPRLSTTGALGSETAHGDLAGYRAKQAHYGSVQSGGDGAGFGVGVPCHFDSTGSLPSDSNRQATTTTGGSDELVIRTGGADDQTDTGQSGGKYIGA